MEMTGEQRPHHNFEPNESLITSSTQNLLHQVVQYWAGPINPKYGTSETTFMFSLGGEDRAVTCAVYGPGHIRYDQNRMIAEVDIGLFVGEEENSQHYIFLEEDGEVTLESWLDTSGDISDEDKKLIKSAFAGEEGKMDELRERYLEFLRETDEASELEHELGLNQVTETEARDLIKALIGAPYKTIEDGVAEVKSALGENFELVFSPGKRLINLRREVYIAGAEQQTPYDGLGEIPAGVRVSLYTAYFEDATGWESSVYAISWGDNRAAVMGEAEGNQKPRKNLIYFENRGEDNIISEVLPSGKINTYAGQYGSLGVLLRSIHERKKVRLGSQEFMTKLDFKDRLDYLKAWEDCLVTASEDPQTDGEWLELLQSGITSARNQLGL